jgi:hypothetical protein
MNGCFSRESARGREEGRTTEQIQSDGLEQGQRPGKPIEGGLTVWRAKGSEPDRRAKSLDVDWRAEGPESNQPWAPPKVWDAEETKR